MTYPFPSGVADFLSGAGSGGGAKDESATLARTTGWDALSPSSPHGSDPRKCLADDTENKSAPMSNSHIGSPKNISLLSHPQSGSRNTGDEKAFKDYIKRMTK